MLSSVPHYHASKLRVNCFHFSRTHWRLFSSISVIIYESLYYSFTCSTFSHILVRRWKMRSERKKFIKIGHKTLNEKKIFFLSSNILFLQLATKKKIENWSWMLWDLTWSWNYIHVMRLVYILSVLKMQKICVCKIN